MKANRAGEKGRLLLFCDPVLLQTQKITLHCDNCLFIVLHFSFQWCQRYRSAADHTSLSFSSAALSLLLSCLSISFYSSIRIFTRFQLLATFLNGSVLKKGFFTGVHHQRRCFVLLDTLHAAIMFVFLRKGMTWITNEIRFLPRNLNFSSDSTVLVDLQIKNDDTALEKERHRFHCFQR